MGTEIKTWQLIEGKLISVDCSLTENNRKEREHLEQWIKSNSEILGQDIVLIGEQVQTKSGPLDFLGIDDNGNTVIIELKRDKLPREVLAQAIDYASDISTWNIEKFNIICQNYTQQPLYDYLVEKFPTKNLEEITLNQIQRILLVGFSIDESLNRMIEWLSENYNVVINAIILNYIKTKNDEELLSRTVIIPEDIVDDITKRRKFKIETSDEPGNYENNELKEKLKHFLSLTNMITSQRMKDYFLPILLKKDKITRENLKKELTKVGCAQDESKAGYYIVLISNQLGFKWNDFLRQVISYDYPRYRWEKDNFKINEEYKELIKNVLEDLK